MIMPNRDRFDDEDLQGDDFEGGELEYNSPHDAFDDEDFEGDDFIGNRADVG